MKQTILDVDCNLKENFQFYDSDFPFGIWIDDYGTFAEHTLPCHWHDSFEIVLVLSGTLEYIIDNVPVILEKGQAAFVNMNSLHMAVKRHSENAVAQVFVFKPEVLTGSAEGTIYQKYFLPIIGSDVQGFRINTDTKESCAFYRELAELSALDSGEDGYELRCIAHLSRVWDCIFYFFTKQAAMHIKTKKRHYIRNHEMRTMLSYIQQNYMEPLSISSLMKCANISRSECFRCFKFFTCKNPVEYINEYRLSKAARLLCETNLAVTEICFSVGFTNTSYFGKMFKMRYGFSPLQYRNRAVK